MKITVGHFEDKEEFTSLKRLFEYLKKQGFLFESKKGNYQMV